MAVRLMLANRLPMLLWWGPQYISIYNDAYIPILGAKHPWALGRPVSECWSEIWDVLRPLIDTSYLGGPATWNDDLQLEIKRHGFLCGQGRQERHVMRELGIQVRQHEAEEEAVHTAARLLHVTRRRGRRRRPTATITRRCDRPQQAPTHARRAAG